MSDRKLFDWINEESVTFLRRGYLSEGEEPLDRIKTIANHAEKLLEIEGFADKFVDYMGRGWYSLSSPVWANFGKKRGLPISCFGSNIGDNIESILYTQAEVGEMSTMGGGTSGYFGNIRGRGAEITDNGHAPGAVHFMNLFQSVVDNISQGSTRRGRFSPYLPIEHPDIMEFLEIGTEGATIQDLTHAVTVSDEFMNEMIAGDTEKRAAWAKVIQRRGEIGYPYIMFSDTMNKNTVDVYKDKNAKIYNSNLCSEIALHNSEEESFVCVLSSMNVLHYDEWKDTDAVETLTYFLDAVVTEFCTKIEAYRDNGTIESLLCVGTWDDKAALKQVELIDKGLHSNIKGEVDKEYTNRVNPIPGLAKVRFSVHGVSGFKVGDMIQFEGIPFKYGPPSFYQIISVGHSMSGMVWQTDITCDFRLIGDEQ